MKPAHRATYFLLNLSKSWLSSTSKRSRNKVASYIAGLLFHNLQFRKSLARENIRNAFPKWSELKVDLTLKKTYLFFAQNFIDLVSTPKSWNGIKIKVEGGELLNSAMAENKGVILISGHFGCWEILGKWLGEYAHLFTGVALRQKNRGANQFFQEQREIPGTKHIFRKEPITITWMDNMQAGDVVIDIGANVGMYSLMSAVSRSARVYAFEPESSNYNLLCQNILSLIHI